MAFTAYQINRHAAARIKMGRIRLTVGIYRHQHPLSLYGSLKNTLFVCQVNRTEITKIQRP